MEQHLYAKLCVRVLVSSLIWIIWSPNLTGQCLGFEFGEIECPEICVCRRDNKGFDVDCTARNLTKIPTGINEDVVKLELSMNNLTSIPDFTFKKFRKLESLYLVGNSLTTLSSNVFNGLVKLTSLFLQDNKFKEVPRDALRSIPSLQTLYLDANDIEVVPPDSFQGMDNLKQLRLDANRITEIPVAALNHARNLGAIHLGLNKISRIPDYAFRNLNNLIVLMLSANVISEVGDHAFEGLPVLYYLELNKNLLGKVPAALISLPDLVDLNIAENRIQHLENDTFIGNRKLETVDLKDNPIRSIAINAFSNLPELKELMISEASDQTVFPSLTGTRGLDKIIFDRAAITALPGDLCTNMDKLKVLDVHSNKITEIPDMSGCTELTLLNLGHNQIATLREGQFDGLFNLKDLILNNNLIDGIPALVFLGLSKLIYLDLSFNRIRYIDEMAFASVTELTDLNLSDNKFSYLPTKGLSNLKQLKTFHNKELIEPPPYDALPKIQTLALAYAYHCCEFVKKGNGVKKEPLAVQEKVEWTKGNGTGGPWRFKENETYDIHDPDVDWPILWDEDYYENNTEMSLVLQVEDIMLARPPVDCRPLPGPFLPCDDLFGWWSLRCGVWIVFLLAVLGNGAVLFVSITSRSKMDVPRFLICNLACSDFFMGIYLGFLAIVDASTLGEFKKYAVQWQLSSGCLVAGFLGVLSSELSVFTLCVITLERLYAISNAIQLSKRMSLKQAGCIMLCGWLFAIAVASLPLFDISDYKKFAICLPFEKETAISLGYVCFIMIFNAITFCIIVISYIAMYVSIRGAHSWNSTDSRMAKRMALLVFTDFFCWAPIIFFSITAAFESNLARISLDEAKVLTIFVLPLNSCANPFLYAFFTRQFKRDCVKLCKRIEESNFSRHFSSSVNRRVSLSSNRGPSHLNSSFTVEKIGSCSRSLSNGSTSGEVNNEREMAKETDLRRAEITDASDALQYVRSDSGICMGDGRTIQLDDSSPVSDRPKTLKLPTTLDFENQDGYSRLGSTPNIVLHTDEGEIYLCAPSKIQNETECKIPLIPAERSTQVQRGENNISSNSKYTKGLENEIPKRPSSKTEIDFGNQINSVKKRVKRNLRSSVKDSDKPQNKHKIVSVNPRSRRENCSAATQTDSEIKLRDRPVIQNLPGAINSSDRNKEINEWRKTSHLSFLWRNSQDFDPFLPQQKSNSLVELTRQIRDWGDSSCKRHSLSSRHEGYILLKNSSRDSAYDEDDLYEFHNKSLCIPSTKSKTVNASDIQETCLCKRGDSVERIDLSWHQQHSQPLGNEYVDQYSFRTTALLESVSSDEDDEGFRIERNNEPVDKESGVRFDS